MHVKMLQQAIRLAQWSDVSHRTAVLGAMRDCFLFYDFSFSYVVVFLLFWSKNIFYNECCNSLCSAISFGELIKLHDVDQF